MSKQNVNQKNSPQIKEYLCGERVVKQEKEKIEEVRPVDNIGYEILTDQNTGFIISKKLTDVVPHVGDVIVFYTIWFSRVVGLELNENLLYFLSEDDV